MTGQTSPYFEIIESVHVTSPYHASNGFAVDIAWYQSETLVFDLVKTVQ